MTSITLQGKREYHTRESFEIFLIQHEDAVLFNIVFYVNKLYIYIFWSEQVSASVRFSIWGKWNHRFVKKAVFIYFVNFLMFTFCLYCLTQQVIHFFDIALVWCTSEKNWKLIWKKYLNSKWRKLFMLENIRSQKNNHNRGGTL